MNHISRYELNCGCCLRQTVNGFEHKLFQEHTVYHVQIFDLSSPARPRTEWNSFRLLEDARKNFRLKRARV
jgi:hypothetical protein